MTKNPWRDLPDKKPYVLPDDAELVRQFNERLHRDHDRFLHIDEILPEPFIGDRNAPVILLSNNPGFGEKGPERGTPVVMERMRKNLRHETLGYPFIFLDPVVGEIGKWWDKKLKDLLGRFSREVVARSVLNVVYFPYPSARFGHEQLRLRSQVYSFDLVRAAMKRNAVIVFMRTPKTWKKTIPELEQYENAFKVCNTQNPAISPNNCPEGEYEKVVAAIAAAEAKRQQA